MSFDHWWMGFFVEESEHAWLAAEFASAAEQAMLDASEEALAAWRRSPGMFDQDAAMGDALAAEANRFIAAFNLPGFDALAARFATEGGYAEFAERRFFRWVMAAQHTPVSILWRALGPERVDALPGRMGNMLIHPRDIAEAERVAHKAYEGAAPERLLDAARRYCGWSVADDQLREIIGFLPDGLAEARQRGQGLLALARAQI